MNAHHTTSTYSEAFRIFLEHTDEKKVLLEALTKHLQTLETESLLDIGAGNGSLSIPLAKIIKHYIALEQKNDYEKLLRDAGLEVIHQSFPCEITKHFDAVVLSHALPPYFEGRESWESFVSAAWLCVNDTGHLLIITFEDEDSEWSRLIKSSNLEIVKPQQKRLKQLKKYLESFGMVEEETITTYVRTKTLKEMVQALSFVWSDGKAEHIEIFLANKSIAEHLEKNYRTATGYSFPFHHYLLDISQR